MSVYVLKLREISKKKKKKDKKRVCTKGAY